MIDLTQEYINTQFNLSKQKIITDNNNIQDNYLLYSVNTIRHCINNYNISIFDIQENYNNGTIYYKNECLFEYDEYVVQQLSITDYIFYKLINSNLYLKIKIGSIND